MSLSHRTRVFRLMVLVYSSEIVFFFIVSLQITCSKEHIRRNLSQKQLIPIFYLISVRFLFVVVVEMQSKYSFGVFL